MLFGVLASDNSAARARAPGSEHQQWRAAKRANGIGRRWNHGQSCLQRRLLRRTEQIHESKNGPRRRANPESPCPRHKIRCHRLGPEKCRKEQQNKHSRPLKAAPGLRVHMRIPATHRANPVSPKSTRQDRNPEDVPHVKRPYLHGPARRPAHQAIVVAKSQALRPPMIHAINNVQHRPAPLVHSETPRIFGRARLQPRRNRAPPHPVSSRAVAQALRPEGSALLRVAANLPRHSPSSPI